MLLKTFTSHFLQLLLVGVCFYTVASYGQKKTPTDYLRYLDSAEVYVLERPELAERYLDSIPEPLQTNIEGHIACYYRAKGLINGKKNELAQLYQNYLLAIKHAETEENYDVAGMASLELFYNIYIVKEDSTAFKYLEDAKTYYTKGNNAHGLVEVMQMPAYMALYNKEYAKSNKLILEHLDEYKSIKDDGYYYLYALFMLTANYALLDDLDKAHYYFSQLKALKSDSTIPTSLLDLHMATLSIDFGLAHFRKAHMDSTLVYLQKAGEYRQAMSKSDIRNYFGLYVDYYDATDNLESKIAYVDSLRHFEELLLNKNIDASLHINKALIRSESQLLRETKKKQLNRVLLAVLSCVLLGLAIYFIVYRKRIKQMVLEFTNRKKEFSYLKSNHEKLKAKMYGLEEYISDIKKEIKLISNNDDIEAQRQQIKELYKNIHLNSSTLITKGKSHLELISDLNVEFFTKMEALYPQLNHSEVILCYYLFTGFKNKEIAAFLNVSSRSIESKRYRISKKMNLQEESVTLIEHLNLVFKDLKKPEN